MANRHHYYEPHIGAKLSLQFALKFLSEQEGFRNSSMEKDTGFLKDPIIDF